MTTPFADAFDHVAQAVSASRRFADENTAAKPTGISAEAISDDGAVEVSVVDGAIATIRLNPGWLSTTPVAAVEASVRQATNAALEQYQATALAQLSAASPSFAQLQEVMADASARLRTAFDDHLSATVARGEQIAARGYEGTN